MNTLTTRFVSPLLLSLSCLAAAGTQASTGSLLWSEETAGGVSTSLALKEDTLFLGANDGSLFAIDTSGNPRWTFQADGSLDAPPSIAPDGTLYIGSQDKTLRALTANGESSWAFRTGLWIYGSPAVGLDGTVYVSSYDNHLYALNPDGSERWRFATSYWIHASPAIGSDGTVYVGSHDHSLYAINPDGTEKWTYATGDIIRSSAAIGSDGTVYVGSDDDRLHAIQPDGTLRWTYSAGDDIKSSPTVGADGTIYVGSNDNGLHAVNSDGSTSWIFYTNDDISASPVLGADGTIYVGSRDNFIYAINSDGTLSWSYDTGSEVRASPALADDGTLYAASVDGTVHALATSSNGLDSNAPWPRFGQNNTQTGLNQATDDGPELVIRQLTLTPAFPEAGTDVTATLEVANTGNQNASASNVALSLTGTSLANLDIGALEAGATTQLTQTFSWPDAGQFELIANVDSTNQVDELAEYNNQFRKAFAQRESLLIGVNGDSFESGALSGNWESDGWLVNAVNAFAPPAGLNPGDVATATLTQSTSVGFVTFSLQVDAIADEDFLVFLINGEEQDRWTGALAQQLVTYPIAAGENVFSWQYINGSAAHDAASGTWVDDISISSANSQGPDLVLSHQETSGELLAGESVLLSMTVLNQGSALAAATTLSLDALGSTAVLAIPQLDAGASATVTYTLTPTLAGDVNVNAQLDSQSIVSEISELNNLASWSFSVSLTDGMPGTRQWVYQTGDMIQSSAAISSSGQIYAGSRDGFLYAFSAAGALNWTYETGHAISKAVTLSTTGALYVGSADGILHALTADAEVLWTYNAGAAVSSSAALDDLGGVYFASANRQLHALDATGAVRWIYNTDAIVFSDPAIGPGGHVYFGSGTGLTALSSDGDLLWHYPSLDGIQSSPAIDLDGTVYVGTDDQTLMALWPNGELKWQYETGGAVTSSPAIGSDGIVYFGSSDGVLHAVNSDGTERWTALTDGPVQASPAIGADGTIYIGASDQRIYAYSPEGSLLWMDETDGAITAAPVLADGSLYIGSADGSLYAFNSSSAGLASSAWPSAGQNGSNASRIADLALQPELVITGWQVEPPLPSTDDTVTITAIIENVGLASAGTAELHLDLDNDTSAGSWTLPALAVGEQFAVSEVVTFDEARTYQLQAEVDVGNLITELAEYNNRSGLTLFVAQPRLPGLTGDSLESGGLNSSWQVPENNAWAVTHTTANSGQFSLQSPVGLSDSETATISMTQLTDAGAVSFALKVDSEGGYDTLIFSINDEEVGVWSGQLDWQQVSFPIDAGEHTFTWSYAKDASDGEGRDQAWIDDISLPATIGVSAELVISQVDYSRTLSGPVTVWAEVQNAGATDAGASTVTLVVGGETYTFNVPALAPGASTTVSEQLDLDISQGYELIATADAGNSIQELAEANNSLSTLLAWPDQRVDSFSLVNTSERARFTIPLIFSSQAQNNPDGVEVRLYFNSQLLTWQGMDPSLTDGFTGASAAPLSDADDGDFDVTTDSYVTASWDAGSAWPDQTIPVTLANAGFQVIDATRYDLSTTINVVVDGIVAGTDVRTSAWLDIDGNGETTALSDGLMIIRQLYGFETEALFSGVVPLDAVRSQDDMSVLLGTGVNLYDIDGDGETRALTDGLLIMRHLFGFSESALLDSAVQTDLRQRCNSSAIKTYIDELTPFSVP